MPTKSTLERKWFKWVWKLAGNSQPSSSSISTLSSWKSKGDGGEPEKANRSRSKTHVVVVRKCLQSARKITRRFMTELSRVEVESMVERRKELEVEGKLKGKIKGPL